MAKIYAIVETGGKQYKVTPGQSLDVERLGLADGDTVALDRVLLIADGDKVTVGTPTIDQAKVMATVKGEGKARKVIALKFKSKTRYHRKKGHRQHFTTLAIDQIIGPGAAEEKPKRRASRQKKEVVADGT